MSYIQQQNFWAVFVCGSFCLKLRRQLWGELRIWACMLSALIIWVFLAAPEGKVFFCNRFFLTCRELITPIFILLFFFLICVSSEVDCESVYVVRYVKSRLKSEKLSLAFFFFSLISKVKYFLLEGPILIIRKRQKLLWWETKGRSYSEVMIISIVPIRLEFFNFTSFPADHNCE